MFDQPKYKIELQIEALKRRLQTCSEKQSYGIKGKIAQLEKKLGRVEWLKYLAK